MPSPCHRPSLNVCFSHVVFETTSAPSTSRATWGSNLHGKALAQTMITGFQWPRDARERPGSGAAFLGFQSAATVELANWRNGSSHLWRGWPLLRRLHSRLMFKTEHRRPILGRVRIAGEATPRTFGMFYVNIPYRKSALRKAGRAHRLAPAIPISRPKRPVGAAPIKGSSAMRGPDSEFAAPDITHKVSNSQRWNSRRQNSPRRHQSLQRQHVRRPSVAQRDLNSGVLAINWRFLCIAVSQGTSSERKHPKQPAPSSILGRC